jgi:hypothetical protein
MPRVRWGGFVSPEYLGVLGDIVAQWGFFEGHIDIFHRYLRANPEAEKLSKRLGPNFQTNTQLMRRSAATCFQQCPTLIEKITAVLTAADKLAEQRNRLIHSFWFEHMANDPPVHMWKYEKDGTRVAYAASLQDLKEHLSELHECHGELLSIFIGWGDDGMTNSELTSDEKSALHVHRANHLGNFPDPTRISISHPPRSFRE